MRPKELMSFIISIYFSVYSECATIYFSLNKRAIEQSKSNCFLQRNKNQEYYSFLVIEPNETKKQKRIEHTPLRLNKSTKCTSP